MSLPSSFLSSSSFLNLIPGLFLPLILCSNSGLNSGNIISACSFWYQGARTAAWGMMASWFQASADGVPLHHNHLPSGPQQSLPSPALASRQLPYCYFLPCRFIYRSADRRRGSPRMKLQQCD